MNQRAPSRSPKKKLKNQKKNYFLKVHNELGKVTKFWTSRPLFHGEIEIAFWKKCELIQPPRPIRVKELCIDIRNKNLGFAKKLSRFMQFFFYKGTAREKLKWVFQMYDEDKSGELYKRFFLNHSINPCVSISYLLWINLYLLNQIDRGIFVEFHLKFWNSRLIEFFTCLSSLQQG